PLFAGNDGVQHVGLLFGGGAGRISDRALHGERLEGGQRGTRSSYSARRRTRSPQNGSGVRPARMSAKRSRWTCQPALTPTIFGRSGRRRCTTVSSVSSPRGSSVIDTSPSPCQANTSLRGGST